MNDSEANMEKISLSPILQGKEREKTVLQVVSLNKAPIGAIDRERRERDTARERNFQPKKHNRYAWETTLKTAKKPPLTLSPQNSTHTLAVRELAVFNAKPYEHGEPGRAKKRTISEAAT